MRTVAIPPCDQWHTNKAALFLYLLARGGPPLSGGAGGGRGWVETTPEIT